MSGRVEDQASIDKEELEFDQSKLRRIRERVLEAEKEKLHLDTPRGVINNIEDIVREEID
jgi:hypothetical protein